MKLSPLAYIVIIASGIILAWILISIIKFIIKLIKKNK